MWGRRGLLTTLLALTAGSCLAHPGYALDGVTVVSPDRDVQCRISLHGARLGLAVTFRGRPVVEPSPMGMSIDGVVLAEGVELGAAEPYRMDETYPWRGVHAQAVNHCRGARIPLVDVRTRTTLTLDVRASDDAVAFRFLIPGDHGRRVPDESTTFRLPADSTVWSHDLEGHYEGQHRKQDIAAIPAGTWAVPPLTFKLPDSVGYAAITEAALVNYGGMALQADGRGGFGVRLAHTHPISYPYRLRYSPKDIERVSRPAAISGPITTPWRVVMIGTDLNALVNCDMVPNLCPPPDPTLFPEGTATEWLRPGRAVWKYLDGGEATVAGMEAFCRWAGELGFEYNVLEGFWRRWSDDELRGLVAYGRRRGVGLWVWRNAKDLRDPEARRQFFQRCHDLGIDGVKLDFFDHEAKEVIDLYQALLREAAAQRLLVNFHGSNKPTGEARTWPNELTREAVRGMEARALYP